MIQQQSIDALKSQLDIVEVISHYIEVKKMGSSYKACCPFHQEKTPSFVINANKGFYHCFGCGASGDSIKFVMEYEKLSYIEAIEKLAQIYNVTLEYSNENKKYNPASCYNANQKKESFDCIQGYQDSWERNSEVAPRTPKDNSNN